jgi:hypothetical protein
MTKKCDYLKGVTTGLKLAKRFPHYRSYHTRDQQADANRAMHNAEDKYRDSLGENDSLGLPLRESTAWERAMRFSEGVRNAFDYSRATVFVVCRYRGDGNYTIADLVEYRVYIDPAEASARAWHLDPNGHNYTSRDILWISGASDLLTPGWEIELTEGKV